MHRLAGQSVSRTIFIHCIAMDNDLSLRTTETERWNNYDVGKYSEHIQVPVVHVL